MMNGHFKNDNSFDYYLLPWSKGEVIEGCNWENRDGEKLGEVSD